MLPEKGGAGYFSLIVCDRLTDLGRPVTRDEVVAAVWESPGLPWAYVTQAYQQHLCTANSGRDGTTPDGAVPSAGFDESLGWHHPSFDGNNPRDRRKALTYVVGRRLNNHSATNGERRQWAIRDPDGRYRRNPDVHPNVVSNGARHDWSPETRAEVEQRGRDEMAVITAKAVARRPFTLDERATLLRHLTNKLPTDRSAAGRMSKSGRLEELDLAVGDDPDKVLDMIRQLVGDPT